MHFCGGIPFNWLSIRLSTQNMKEMMMWKLKAHLWFLFPANFIYHKTYKTKQTESFCSPFWGLWVSHMTFTSLAAVKWAANIRQRPLVAAIPNQKTTTHTIVWHLPVRILSSIDEVVQKNPKENVVVCDIFLIIYSIWKVNINGIYLRTIWTQHIEESF